jgi:hypothetical protein
MSEYSLRGDDRAVCLKLGGEISEVGRVEIPPGYYNIPIGVTIMVGDREFCLTGLSQLEARAFGLHMDSKVTLTLEVQAP